MAGRIGAGTINRLNTKLSDWFEAYFILALAVVILLLGINEIVIFGMSIARWDYMFISGWITVVVGLRLALRSPEKMDNTLDRLVNRGALQARSAQFEHFKTHLINSAGRWAFGGGVFIAVVILLSFVTAFGLDGVLSSHLSFTVISIFGGYVVGRYLGRFAFYGQLAGQLKNAGIAIKADPGHLDGVAGLKPIGELYFGYAMLLALPALYFAAWWLLIPLFGRYESWRSPYLSMLAITIVLEMLSFILPMWSFHNEMVLQKNVLLEDADKISREVAHDMDQLIAETDPEKRRQLQEHIDVLKKRYSAIEKMPTWPMDDPLRRRFAIRNFGLFTPLIGEALNLTETWDQVLAAVKEIVLG